MLPSSTLIIKGYKKMDVPYTLLRNEANSKNLAIFLPGIGYTVRSPAFHFSEAIFVNKYFDILKVDYRYNDAMYDDFSMDDLTEAIIYDVRTVIDEVLQEGNYENFYLVGKSLGTIAMSSELQREIFADAKAIWLTPLLHKDEVFDAMLASKNEGLCMIGDNDRCYTADRYNRLLENQNITSKLYPHVNHSMEYDNDPVGSIDVLKSVINEIEHF